MKLEQTHAWLVIMILLATSNAVFADVYKCKRVDGGLAYSDYPCPKNGTKINLTPNDFGGINLPKTSLNAPPQRVHVPPSRKMPVLRPSEIDMNESPTHVTNLVEGSQMSPTRLLPFPSQMGTTSIAQPQDSDGPAWKLCTPNSIGPGGCDSISPGGGQSIGPGGGQSIGPGGGQSIGPGGGQSIGPGGGQSIAPGGGQSMMRDRRFGLNPDTMRPYTCVEGGPC